jgi:RimJ/RimL family protein N-acetyltransferase
MESKLRSWKESDLTNLVKYANNWEIAKNLTDKFPFPYNEENGKAFIHSAIQHKTALLLAIDVNNDAVGSIGVFPQDDIHKMNAELDYWLAEPFWNKGIITKAIQEIVSLSFNKFEINRIFARPFGSNIASQKVLEKAGFKLEARFEKTVWKNNQFEDQLIFAFRK